MISEALRRQRSRAGAIGGNTLWLRQPDRIPDTSHATAAQYQAFGIAHGGDPAAYAHLPRRMRPVGLCSVCPKRVVVPESADDERRADLATALRSQHYARMADLAVAKRRRTG